VAAPASTLLDRRLAAIADRLLTPAVRPELAVVEIPPPMRICSHAAAVAVDTPDTGLSGHLVALLDPSHAAEWAGEVRLVAYVRAAVEREIAEDPLVCEIGWAWLDESLAPIRPVVTHLAGTVTTTRSSSFGLLDRRPPEAHVEVRASWTALDDEVAPHAGAWHRLLSLAGGLPPLLRAAAGPQ